MTYLVLVVVKVVFRDLEVQGSRALADAATDVVVATVAGAEPAVVVASLTDRHTSQMRADTNHDEPLRALDTLSVRLGVAQLAHVHVLSLLDLIRSTVTDKHGLAAPLDDGIFTLGDVGHVDLDLGERKDIARGTHRRQEVGNGRTSARGSQGTEATDQEVGEGTVRLGGLGTVLAEVRGLKSAGRGREGTDRGRERAGDLG